MALCVLTGDIVGSTRLTNAQQVRIHRRLEDALLIAEGRVEGSFETYRGDGWQLSFSKSALWLRTSLYIRSMLRSEDEKFDTRIAVAEGRKVASFLSKEDSPFVISGRCLDNMPSGIFMAHSAGGLHHSSTILADHLSRGWTQAQARAIMPFLLPDSDATQSEIGKLIGISRQAVGQALDAAGYPAIKAALAAIEEQAK